MQIEITEVGPRDGLQNEPHPVSTAQKVQLIEGLVAAGARRFEATSFVSPRAVPQMGDAEQVLAALSVPDDIVLQALVPNLRGAERAAQTRVQEWVCFLSATESHSLANSNCSVEDALDRLDPVMALSRQANRRAVAALAVTFGCPFEGVTPTERVVALVRALRAIGFTELKLGDTIGTAIPSQISRVVAAIRKAVPDMELFLHLQTRAACRWPMSWPVWRRASRVTKARWAGSAAAPSPPVRRAISPPKTSCISCTPKAMTRGSIWTS